MDHLLFDTHAHYGDGAFDTDRDGLLAGLAALGVAYVVNIGYDIESSEFGRDLSSRYDYIYYAAGIHPHDAADAPQGFETGLTDLLNGEKAVALGEIGLDYHYGLSPRDVQKDVFAKQLALAGKLRVPVVIHDREAHSDVLDILLAHKSVLCGGVMHCFSGDRDFAAKTLGLGFYIAFGGTLTFKNSGELADAAAYVPADRLLLETDCPYLSPAPYRGRRNDSSRLSVIARRLAQIRGESADGIADVTTVNAKNFFGIK